MFSNNRNNAQHAFTNQFQPSNHASTLQKQTSYIPMSDYNLPTEENLPPILPGYPQGQFYNPGLAINNQNSLAYKNEINQQQIQMGGFNSVMYFNDKQNFVGQKNKSFEQIEAQTHYCILIINLILIIGAIGAFILIIVVKVQIWILAQMVAIPFIIYFFISLCGNTLSIYTANMKSYSEMNEYYNQMKQQNIHIKLSITCYHFHAARRNRKMVTFTTSEIVPVKLCVDQSQDFKQIKKQKSFMYCKIDNCFYFGDMNSQLAFQNIVNSFKMRNAKDQHQIVTHTLQMQTPGAQPFIGVSLEGSGNCLRPLFYLCLLLGMAFPYLAILERIGTRYQINMMKRLSL